ncbi:MAG: M16 family metallopeptidase [Aristaeellaceae bacterium]
MSAVHEYHLPNGMTMLVSRQQHLHAMEFSLFLKGGALYENRQTQGICHLLEHLCFRGLGQWDAEGLNRLMARFGAELDGSTYPEGVVFRLKTHPRFFDEVLELFLAFFAHVPWTPAMIAAEKEVVIRQIEQDDVDFEEEVARRYRRTAEGAYPMMGTAEVIRDMSAETIRQWQQLLFQPGNACLCIAGNISEGMEQAAQDAFAELPAGEGEPPFMQTVPLGFCMRDSHSDLILDEEGGQAKVHLAFDMDDDRVFPLAGEVLNAITAGNSDSLLFQTLREEKALVAEIDSSMEEMGLFRRLIIRYDVRQEYLTDSLRQVFTLLTRLKMYIRPVRLTQTRMQFTDNLQFYLDDVSGLADLMGWSWMADDLARCDLDAQAQMYDDLTCEDLLDAAQSVFRPENLTISIQRDPDCTPRNLKPLLHELRTMLS